jgi:asparagine synthase (glutamine-hydrolysing)
MCSIAGTTGTGIEEMIRAMKHRSPDEIGFFRDEQINLGMGRLKILDLTSPGLCPYQEENLVLCYNGEIYNYIELKRDLKKMGWNFRTTSDTEVLMKAWRQWGTEMFDKLNGMFALALYDKQEKKIFLARDIAGEKPLYFYAKGQDFAFASEAKAFKSIIPLEYEPNSFFDAFQHCHIRTLWKDIQEVPPAHYLIYDLRNYQLTLKPYWEFEPRTVDIKNAPEELEALLEDAVTLRTRSDVPYGLYFSGGIDSSLLSSLHEFEHKFYFDEQQDWKDDFFEKIGAIAWHLDFPVGSLSSYPLWKLAEWASQKVKVVLSGEGADELFGGYVRYLPVAREWELRKAYPSYSSLFNKYFPNSGYLDSFANITARNENADLVRSLLKPHFEKFSDPVTAMGYADFKLILPSLLQMGDRMASAFGMENRCPFLDRRIIEFAFSLGPEMKIVGVEQKRILRRILEKRGVVEPLKQEKKGLTIVFNQWLGRKDWNRSLYFQLLQDKWAEHYDSHRMSGRETKRK